MIKENKMTAVTLSQYGGAEFLNISEVDIPTPRENEVLIKVMASGINRPDILQRQGNYPPPKGASDILGLEVAGIITEVGSAVKKFKVGDSVMALLTGGGYAEYATASEGCCLRKPTNLSYLEASGFPEVLFTVWYNIFMLGKLQQQEILLIHGGSSGIGTMAIQLAKSFGAKVIVTAGSADKCKACIDLGADLAINYKEKDFVEEVLSFTENNGANVILDMVGNDYVDRNYKAAALGGRILQIAFLNGARAQVNLARLMTKRLQHFGSTLRSQSDSFKKEIAKELEQYILPLIENGTIKPCIDKVYPLEQVKEAHQYFDKGKHIGKVLLEVNQVI